MRIVAIAGPVRIVGRSEPKTVGNPTWAHAFLARVSAVASVALEAALEDQVTREEDADGK